MPYQSRIFVSSPVTYLRDLRGELSKYIKDELQLTVVNSNDILAEFDTTHSDAIEVCLANVRACTHVLVLLDHYYGSAETGKSVSWLEYDTAVSEQKEVLVLVRDELMAAHQHWCETGKPDKLLFLNKVYDAKQFSFLETVQLDNKWREVFSTSVDAKLYVSRWLRRQSMRSQLLTRLSGGDFPIFGIFGMTFNQETGILQFHVKIIDGSAARFIVLRDSRTSNVFWQKSILEKRIDHPGSAVQISNAKSLMRKSMSGSVTLNFEIQYQTTYGASVVEELEYRIPDSTLASERLIPMDNIPPIIRRSLSVETEREPFFESPCLDRRINYIQSE